MVGIAIKNYAKENNLTVSNGVAYGLIAGMVSTLTDGWGTKTLVVTTKIKSEYIDRLKDELKENAGRFQLKGYSVEEDCITIIFVDRIGFMKEFERFRMWFYDLIKGFSATGSDICPICGKQNEINEKYRLINNDVYRAHLDCVNEKIKGCNEKIDAENKKNNEKKYISGIIGSFLGALAGGLIYMLLYLLSKDKFYYYSGVVVLALSLAGYRLFKGKIGRFTLLIIILTSLIGDLLASYGFIVYNLMKVVQPKIIEIPYYISLVLQNEYINIQFKLMLSTGALCIIFGGIILCFDSTLKSVKKIKIIEL